MHLPSETGRPGSNCSLIRKSTIAETVGGDNSVPTFTPLPEAQVKKPSKRKVAAIIGGIGAALLVVVTGVTVCFCLMRLKRLIRRASDTASSVPSPRVLRAREDISPGSGAVSPYDTFNLWQLSILELEQATGNFNQINLVGEGSFGLVYKGLLGDGSIVAIKRCLHCPVQYFVNEVTRIASVHHRHLVKLIGYCKENYQQFLVYDYLPNGNVGNHLYDSEGLPIGKLDMRQRLIIALGAAKGLEHLHSLVPPILHMHFRTRNVLVDESFTAKVSDFGLSNLPMEGYYAESSSAVDCFRDPELRSSHDFSERSDVYSFGIFLLELISGREALGRNHSDVQENLVSQAKGTRDIDNFVDKTVKDHTLHAVQQMMELALLCLDTGTRRPVMRRVVEELERIRATEIGHLHSGGLGEEIGMVTLGSDLFK
ncbi:probable serine/threonine-protein kinase PBL28 isoform X2 [Rhododendron vialii]|uniref:probable serine/threonine-protein kinase PBL28 isoform X2 n=1 Tax=Rhododendron vialii TaxID=182163 RepID=UPI00265EBA86|nr:probable serine/threonine-protein kinase PBL28 isoform X2 [Rhododendron vialii]